MNLIQDVLRAAESKPEQDRFVRVKLEDILPDPENFYNTDEIEELAAAIDAFGWNSRWSFARRTINLASTV